MMNRRQPRSAVRAADSAPTWGQGQDPGGSAFSHLSLKALPSLPAPVTSLRRPRPPTWALGACLTPTPVRPPCPCAVHALLSWQQ